MLLAALGSVRIGKNCDLGLGFGQHFQDLGHSFSLYGPPSRPITAISKTGNGEWRNGEWGTGNGEWGISKRGNL